MKYCYVITLLLLTQINVSAQPKKSAYNELATIEQWQVIDLVFEAAPASHNPYNASFKASFTNGAWEKIIHGFYDGDSTWAIRFSASDTGTWKFITSSDIALLNGKTGQVTVTFNTNPVKHGGIITLPTDPQNFFYEDGTPYMQTAFECDWLFALDYHNKTDIPKTEHLLDLLESYNFNQIVTTVYSFDVNWGKDPKLPEHPEYEYGGDLSIYPFLGNNSQPDFSQLNVSFFQKLDRTITAMHDRNITAHLMIYVWNKMVNWPAAESEADNMYFDYIIKRYQAFPNIVWDVSKEALNNERCSELYGLERIERIRKLDAFERLVSVHDYGFCRRNTDAVDFISIQNWSANLYTDMLNIKKQFPNKPIFNIEHGGYEQSYYDVFSGDYISPEVCIRRNYLINFTGSYATYYWQGTSWNVIIHNPFEQAEEFPKPHFEYYRYLAKFFNDYPLIRFKPKKQYNYSSYCLTDNNGTFLLYLPKEHYAYSVYWKSEVYSKTGTIQWYNTLTGEYGEEIQIDGKNVFVNPWHNEADVILIRKH